MINIDPKKLVTIASNMSKVYEAGADDGIAGVTKEVGTIKSRNHVLYSKLKAIADKIKDIYNAGRNSITQLKTLVSGSTIKVTDVNAVEHSVGCNVSSKNLLDITGIIGTSVTAYGGTLTCGEDGGITGSGTPTNSVAFSTSNGLDRHFLPSATYVLSSSGEYTNIVCSVYLRKSSGSSIVSFGVNGSGKSTVINCADYPEYSYMIIEIKRGNNDVEMSGTAYFQLEAGSTATAYTPYTSDLQSFNVSRYGKNLLEFKQGFITNATLVEYLDNGVIAKGNLTSDTHVNSYNHGWYNFSKRTSTTLKSGDVVTISADYTILELAEGRTNGQQVGIYLYGAKDNSATSTVRPALNQTVRIYCTYTITVDGDYYPIITLNSNKVRIENIQIEVGSKSTAFEEYKSKQTATAAADGTVEGLTTVSPSMTLWSDNAGVVINAEYCKQGE